MPLLKNYGKKKKQDTKKNKNESNMEDSVLKKRPRNVMSQKCTATNPHLS